MSNRCAALRLGAALALAWPLALPAQVQVRLGDSSRTVYSELHEALQPGTPAADSVSALLEAPTAGPLWGVLRAAVRGERPWNDAFLALNRIAALREPSSKDSAAAWTRALDAGTLQGPPATDLDDLRPGLHAVLLELDRAAHGDAAILAGLLPRIPAGDYDLGDAWVFGRLRGGAADTVARRFEETGDRNLRIRYLTLLSFSTDTALVPLLARVFAAPDSFGLPRRIGSRASDGLIWIGTRGSVQALLDARAAARARGTYADPALGHADLDFLGNDSSVVVSRTGRWLTDWLERLR